MIGVSRQRNQGGAFDTYFAPGSPYFVASPWQSIVRRESVPPYIRKRIGFEQIKVVPNRWQSAGGPGGVPLWGTLGGASMTTLAMFALLIIGGVWIWNKGGKKTVRKILRGGK